MEIVLGEEVERYLKQCNIIDEEDTISSTMEAVSLDDTLREMESVIISGLNENKVILVNLVHMYPTIEEFG